MSKTIGIGEENGEKRFRCDGITVLIVEEGIIMFSK